MSGTSDMSEAVVPWPNKKDDYYLEDSIGVGATATVYKVCLQDASNIVDVTEYFNFQILIILSIDHLSFIVSLVSKI